jgi:hypothetical protein
VFLGAENTIPGKVDCPAGSAVSDHIDSFCIYVWC